MNLIKNLLLFLESLTALNTGKNLSQKDKANLLRHSKIKQSQPDKSQSLPQTQQSQVINNISIKSSTIGD